MFYLKPVTEKDFSTIARLAKIIWNKHYISIISQAQIDYMLAKIYSQEALKKQEQEGQVFYLVINNEQEIGFIAVSTKDNRNYFLHKFYILNEKQNAGLGSAIFKHVFEELYKPKSVRLNVNRQNYKSVNFYFKMGFKIEKVTDLDIGEGYFMDDFVMVWQKL